MSGAGPEVSILIPVHDEEPILADAVEDLRARLAETGIGYELWLCENGSRDATALLARLLSERYDEVHSFSLGEPNYGLALRRGIERARGELVVCEEIDLCDVAFLRQAVAILRGADVDMVIGSKLCAGAEDGRPLLRHATSQIYNALLRVTLGFRGTDTHGLKAFRRAVLAPIAARCVVDKDVFASELVIRAYREGVRIQEIPVRLRERRPPSVDLLRRVPNVLASLLRLLLAMGRG